MRSQYLHARETLRRLLDLGVVPVVNENDTVADDEIRFGDNDRLAALVAHLVGADLLVLLTDTAGLFTADPRLDADASLIEEIVEVDDALEAVAGGARHRPGERRHGDQAGGGQDRGLVGRAGGDRGRRRARRARRRASPGRAVGTVVPPRAPSGSSSRKLWIAFAVGAARARRRRRRRPAGAVRRTPLAAARRACAASRAPSTPTTRSRSSTTTGAPFAKGLVRYSADGAPARSPAGGRRSSPTACPTRSSTATTSSSCPCCTAELEPHGAVDSAQRRSCASGAASVTLRLASSSSDRRGESPLYEGFDGRRGAGGW